MAEVPPRRRIRDAELMRALAHPLRFALLNHLMAVGPRTASECADTLASTASNCSWHLRHLAEFGLVERVEGADRRQRPWRACQVGLDIGGFDDDPALRSAQDALLAANLAEDAALTQRFLDRSAELAPDWLQASAFTTYELTCGPDELRVLVEQIDALVRPYLGAARAEVPENADVVHVGLRAFRHLDPGTTS